MLFSSTALFQSGYKVPCCFLDVLVESCWGRGQCRLPWCPADAARAEADGSSAEGRWDTCLWKRERRGESPLKEEWVKGFKEMADSLLIAQEICKKSTRIVFFYSSNHVLWRVVPLPQQLARWLLLDVCSYFHLVLNLNLFRSGRGIQSVLGIGFFLHPLHWCFWSPAYDFPRKELFTPLERMQGAEKKKVIKRPICLYLYLNPG